MACLASVAKQVVIQGNGRARPIKGHSVLWQAQHNRHALGTQQAGTEI
jgi:hypothetical protein